MNCFHLPRKRWHHGASDEAPPENRPRLGGYGRLGLVIVLAWVLCPWSLSAAPPDLAPPSGLRQNTPSLHALVGARLVISPEEELPSGTLIVRDGLIAAIGPKLPIPPEARVWNLEGNVIYAGFLDAFQELPSSKLPTSLPPGGYWNSQVAPQVRMDELYTVDAEANKKLRSQGITLRLLAPPGGIIKGTSAIVNTDDQSPSRAVVREVAALHLRLTPQFTGPRDSYPTSPMGAVALVRQAYLDADWYRRAWAAYRQSPGLSRPERSTALDVLSELQQRRVPVIVDCPDEQFALRADQLGREFQPELPVIVRGSGREYRRLDAVAATGRTIIVPLNFPSAPVVKTPESSLAVPLDQLLHWDLAPENPARLRQAGVPIVLSTHGLKDPSEFLGAIRTAVKRGLPPSEALRALTLAPARLFDLETYYGTLAPGKMAHLCVADGDLFSTDAKVTECWVDGHRYEVIKPPKADLRGTWEVTLLTGDLQSETAKLQFTGKPDKLEGTLHRGDKQSKLTGLTMVDSQLVGTLSGESLGSEGVVQLSITLATQSPAPDRFLGMLSWANGQRTPLTASRLTSIDEKPTAGAVQPTGGNGGSAADPQQAQADKSSDTSPLGATDTTRPESEKPNESVRSALFPVNFPLGAFGRDTSTPIQPAAVLFRNATVWTCGPAGMLEKADVLVEKGRIAAVGQALKAPANCQEIDATGKHLTPGLLDCHSHVATDGGINEQSQSITAEVRIGDFINANDVNIYLQLAGGVTTINVLHGSANTIGGQSQVIKLRWGGLPEQLKFAEAAPGIKFALGENVKQSNLGDSFNTRYPQTRMGVEQLVQDAFRAAAHYRRTWDAWKENPQGIPPRVDLELEVLAEVLEGKRLIHCHSYRQDEILAFLRTCSAFGVKVATLQHILEGYKVADVIAQEGVGASSFSDWWAYKFEVYDAIPYNGALMHRAGVLVSFNSDHPELARRLNTEAAKAVKYGGVAPEEALKFVTLNPAKQLKIDTYVGSLEVGKHADLAVWSGSPLSVYSRCEQTWIDGRKYFDREADAQLRQQAESERAALVQRILSGNKTSDDNSTDKESAPKEAKPTETSAEDQTP